MRKGWAEKDARIAELEKRLSSITEDPKKEAKAAPEDKKATKPRSRATNPDGTPKYNDWDQYDDEKDAWLLEEAEKRAEKRVLEALERREQERLFLEKKRKESEEVRKKYADFDEVVLGPNGSSTKFAQGSPFDVWVKQSNHTSEILYYLHKHPEAFDVFKSLPTTEAAREEFVRLEYRVQQSLSQPEAKSDVEVVEAPKVRVTKAPPPAREVGGRGASAGDPVDSAVANADFRSFKQAANAKDTRKLASYVVKK